MKAAYAEALFPILPELDIIVAGRIDDYTGFGSTTNPKVSFRFRPVDQIMFRGSYGTGFRVPTFNQIFNGTTISPNPGNTLVDPTLCPTGNTTGPQPACAPITPESLSGGNLNLEPETSEQYHARRGVPAFEPVQHVGRLLADRGRQHDRRDHHPAAAREHRRLPRADPAHQRHHHRGRSRTGNFGSRRTNGFDFTMRGSMDGLGGVFTAGLDGTWLLQKREKLLPNLPYSNVLGVFTFTGDLGLGWKHNAFISWRNNDWNITLTQIFRTGYRNQALPGSATRPDFNFKVSDYTLYNLSVGYTGFAPHFRLTAGVRNLFDRDPPFAITYDSNTGAGSSWEPRVADPRGRSFTLAAEVSF